MRHGGVPAPAVQPATRVDADDVPLSQFALAGDAVNNLLVDRHAGDGRERNVARDTFEQRFGALLLEKFIYRCVDFTRCNPRPHHLGRQLVRFPYH